MVCWKHSPFSLYFAQQSQVQSMLISTAFKPLLILRESGELTQGLKTGASLKQFAKSKHGLEFLGLCPECFMWATCCLTVQGWYLHQEQTPCNHQRPLCFHNPALWVWTRPFWLYFAESVTAGRKGWCPRPQSPALVPTPQSLGCSMGNARVMFNWGSSAYS